MANTYSTSDIIKGTLQRVGERTDSTSPLHTLALKYINRAYSDILKGNSVFSPEVREVWPWARKTGSILLPPNYRQGNATLTNGSVNGILSVPPAFSLVGYNFYVTTPTNAETTSYYQIATHVASSANFTLDFGYVEPSGTYGYNAMPLTVNLNQGILRLADPIRQYNTRVLEFGELPQDMGRIYYMNYNSFWEKWPLELLLNDIPSKFTIVSYSDSNMVLRFNKWVSQAIRLDYDYISTQPALTDDSNSIPLVPFEDRDVLEMMAAYYMYLDKKQPADAETYKGLSAQRIAAMKMANQGQEKLGKVFGQIIPRLDDTAVPFWLIQQR